MYQDNSKIQFIHRCNFKHFKGDLSSSIPRSFSCGTWNHGNLKLINCGNFNKIKGGKFKEQSYDFIVSNNTSKFMCGNVEFYFNIVEFYERYIKLSTLFLLSLWNNFSDELHISDVHFVNNLKTILRLSKNSKQSFPNKPY